MFVHDYNGSGSWSREAIQTRYHELAQRLHVTNPSDLRPRELTSTDGHWVYPVMERVIEGIEQGDAACIELGVEFIQEDQFFPFGRLLKSRTARALRRAKLTKYQIETIRKRVTEMLIKSNTPREYKEYAKLVRKIGLGRKFTDLRTRPRGLAPFGAGTRSSPSAAWVLRARPSWQIIALGKTADG